MLTAFTYGLSLAEHPGWRLGKPELAISVRSLDSRLGPRGRRPRRDRCAGSARSRTATRSTPASPIAPDSALDAFVVFAPAVLGPGDYLDIDVGDALPVNIQGVYPIHRSELAYMREHGLEAFWNTRLGPVRRDAARPPCERVCSTPTAGPGPTCRSATRVRAHGVAMEGYYWRLTDPAAGRCIVALCGVCRGGTTGRGRSSRSPSHPGGFVRWRDTAGRGGRSGRARRRRVGAPTARRCCAAPSGGSRVDLGPDARLEAVLEGACRWPRAGARRARRRPGRPRAAPVLAPAPCSARGCAARRCSAARGGARRLGRLRGEELGRRVPGRVVVGPGRARRRRDGRVRRRPPPRPARARAPSSCAPAARARCGFAPPGAVVTRRGRRRRVAAARALAALVGAARGRGGAGGRTSSPCPCRPSARAVMRSEHHLAGPDARRAAARAAGRAARRSRRSPGSSTARRT